MTTFEDGPAQGKTLLLHRAVMFLRVTEENGEFDALDQREDEPKPTENLYAYVIAREPGMCHINRGGGKGGFYVLAHYKFATEQPDDATMRDFDKWSKWCHSHKHLVSAFLVDSGKPS